MLLFGCTTDLTNRSDEDDLVSSCVKTVNIGGKEICLPLINGMRELSDSARVMDLRGAQVSDQNTILGVYLLNNQSDNLSTLSEIVLDDYFKVYVVNSSKDQDLPIEALDWMASEFTKTTIKRDWSDLAEGLERIFDGVQFGQPVLLEIYKPSERVASMVYLAQILEEGKAERYGLMTTSFCAVKDRLVWVVHYLSYDGPGSVQRSKSKSDYFTLRFVDENI